MESEAGYGVSTDESLAYYDRDTSSWRTSQLCLEGESTEFAGTWPSSFIVSKGKLFSRQTLGCHTVENASALLPTPTKSFGVNARGWGLSKTGRRRFSEAVQENALRFGYRPPIALLEWMMGFPDNHTAIEPSALGTQLCRQPSSGSVGESSNTIVACEVKLERNSLSFGRDLSYEEWESVGHELGKVNQAYQWWIGDWINYGEKKYGQTYKQALAVTGMALGTLMNIASVCREYETSFRNEVSFAHHQLAASLEPEQRQQVLEESATRDPQTGKTKPASWVRDQVKAIKNGSVEQRHDQAVEAEQTEENATESEYEDLEDDGDDVLSSLQEVFVLLETMEPHELIVVKDKIDDLLTLTP